MAAGYTLDVADPTDQLNCGGSRFDAYPSPVSLDAGPVGCSPSAAYALACWNGPTATSALCYRDPWQRKVVQVGTGGRLPTLRPSAQPSPLGLVLGNGDRCSLRDGGAWRELDNHPELYGTYSCTGPDVIWGGNHSDGIDRSGRLWKVWLAPGSGHGKLYSMTVRTAYFVGNARA